jgi:alkaline phosphatase
MRTALVFFLIGFTSTIWAQNKPTEIPLPLPKQPKNIVLLIGDGMGISQITAGMVANGNILQLERFSYVGFSKTFSADNIVTDSGAGATALSIGRKANNGAIGVDADSAVYETILESAKLAGKSTGLVATCAITHATPASFAAHHYDRDSMEAIALDMSKAGVDLMIGGGRDYFENRKDNLNLLASMEDRGVQIIRTEEALFNIKALPVAALLWPDDALPKHKGRNDILPKATYLALEKLSEDRDGFFLMVEGSQIDWGGHANESEYIIQEMLDFDAAIGIAIDFAERNKETLVIVTADHETGGYALNGGNLIEKRIMPAFTTKKHTAVMVPVFAFGPGAEAFMGIQDNTQLYEKMMTALDLQRKRKAVTWKNKAQFYAPVKH